MNIKPILLTGASGNLGQKIALHFGNLGWNLKLTDTSPFPGNLPETCTFTQLDLSNKEAVLKLASGCGTIWHFGAISSEKSFSEILSPNFVGLFNIYEAGKSEKARVIFASSHHVVGFHERTTKLDDDCELKPDGIYGVSKVYGEMMGHMYWDKHGVENINLRIGSCLPEPLEARHLSTWLSLNDLYGILEKGTLADKTGSCIIWGASANKRSYWGKDSRSLIGWEPKDSADAWIEILENKITGDPITEKYQGGSFTSKGYTKQGKPDDKKP